LKRTSIVSLISLSVFVTTALPANAQEDAPASEGAETGAPPGVVYVPAPTTTTTTTYGGLPQPGYDPNAHLPSSSRATSDINKGDSFDLRMGNTSTPTARGSENSSYVVEGQITPEAHTVRRGETLWDLSAEYYRNPYSWPRLWAQNPQIQNPNWIYPGDRVRLRGDAAAQAPGIGFNRRRPSVPPDTIFLRETGWIDNQKDDTWGQLVGSETDRMILADESDVYIQLSDKHEVNIGDQLTVFRPLREIEAGDDDKAEGTLVSIRGTVRVDRYNPKTHMVRAHVIETLDVMERGCMVGPVGRRFDVVAPERNTVDLEAHVVAALYPSEFYTQHQVVFLNRGEADGLRPGNRFFAIARGDRWRRSMSNAGSLARLRPKIEDDAPAQVESIMVDADEASFPDETYGEIRVVKVRKHTAAAIVTTSTRELERGVRLVARKGY
jgi:hypothetical protein